MVMVAVWDTMGGNGDVGHKCSDASARDGATDSAWLAVIDELVFDEVHEGVVPTHVLACVMSTIHVSGKRW